jgi:hypothetical protein
MASVAPLMQGLQRSLGLYQSGGIVRVRTRWDCGGKNVMSAYVLLFPKYRVFLKKNAPVTIAYNDVTALHFVYQ